MARTKLRNVCGALAALVAVVAAGAALGAQPLAPAQSQAKVVQAISDCRKMSDRDARLDCYDKAVDALETAQAQGQVVVMDREQVRAVRRQAFGFSMPAISLFGHGTKEEPIDRITVELASAHRDANGRWVMRTTEDAVWRQIDDSDLYKPPQAGSKVAIRHALLGSFFCNVDGQSAIRCTREQ